jgi:ribonuclease HI
MHSQHATSAAQDALDALMRKYPPRPLAITSAEVTTDPFPDSQHAGPQTIIAYTDGSQLGSSMGAGFYIRTGLHHPIRTIVPMGNAAEVFDAELRAIYECLRTCYCHLCQDGLRRRRIHIFTDNQAAITQATHLTQGPGQETARLIHEITTDINNTDSTITVHWVPGHTNNQHRNHRFFHRIRIRSTDLRISVNFQRVLG